VLGFAPDAGEAEIYGSRATDGWQRAHTPEDYAARLVELLTDPDARERWGRAARAVVAGARDGAAWRERVEELYARAARLGPLRAGELTPPVEAAATGARHDVAVLRLHAHSGSAIPADVVRRITAQVAAAAHSDEVRHLFGSLSGPAGVPEQRARYDRAFAAAGPDPDAIAATVDRLRALDAAGAVAQCLLGVAPEHVDAAIPLIEAALAAGEDFDLELVACADPGAYARAAGTLVVAA
jgi:hypothetical protein